MTRFMRLLSLLVPLSLLSACTSTAGPFITRIESAGPGLLRVERCEVVFSTWGSNHIETGECSDVMVPVQPGDPARGPKPPVATAPGAPAVEGAPVAAAR
jgi:hypothetical protein